MALETVPLYLVAARGLLTDEDVPYRWSDDVLVLGLNLGLQEARAKRPDLFIDVTTVPTYTGGDTVVLNEMYRTALLYYIVGWAQLRDEEETSDARASAFMQKFTSLLVTGR